MGGSSNCRITCQLSSKSNFLSLIGEVCAFLATRKVLFHSKDFAFISKKLDEVSLAIDSLNLWVDKTASENNINIELLNAEKEKLK